MTRQEIFKTGILNELTQISFWESLRFPEEKSQRLFSLIAAKQAAAEVRSAVEYNPDLGEYFFVVHVNGHKEIFSLDAYKKGIRQLRDSLNRELLAKYKYLA